MTDDVAIIGIGLHPFGRTDALSGLEQGAHAVRAALQDAGVSWDAVGVAYGGSQDAGNADALANLLGLTGTPFVNVANGCATGGSALASVVAAIRSGMAEIGVAVGFDKHPRGAFNARPADWGLEDYLHWLRVAKDHAPQLHLHAYSPMEIAHMVDVSGLSGRSWSW